MNNVSLYQLSTDYQLLLARLSDADLDATTIADTIEASGLTDDITIKAQGIECVARTLEQFNPVIDAEIERLSMLKAGRVKKAQGLREYLKVNMIACGIDKIESPMFKIKLQNNPPAVDIFEPGLVQGEFMKQPATPPPVPDKIAIKSAINAGIDVQGCRLTHGVRLVVT